MPTRNTSHKEEHDLHIYHDQIKRRRWNMTEDYIPFFPYLFSFSLSTYIFSRMETPISTNFWGMRPALKKKHNNINRDMSYYSGYLGEATMSYVYFFIYGGMAGSRFSQMFSFFRDPPKNTKSVTHKKLIFSWALVSQIIFRHIFFCIQEKYWMLHARVVSRACTQCFRKMH